MTAQSPQGIRYIQQGVVEFEGPVLRVRVDSIDVFADRSMRVNLIIINKQNGSVYICMFPRGIQLVSDALERVTAIGQPEGQFVSSGDCPYVGAGGEDITMAPRDAVRVSLRFPPFRGETKTARFACYSCGLGMNVGDFIIPNIALFSNQ